MDEGQLHALFRVLRENMVQVSHEFSLRVRSELHRIQKERTVHAVPIDRLFRDIAVDTINLFARVFGRSVETDAPLPTEHRKDDNPPPHG